MDADFSASALGRKSGLIASVSAKPGSQTGEQALLAAHAGATGGNELFADVFDLDHEASLAVAAACCCFCCCGG